MNARCQRALARNRCDAVEEVPEGPREESPVKSDAEEEDILEERDQVPLRIRIPGAPHSRDRSGSPVAEIASSIDPGMWLNMVNVKPPHLSDQEVQTNIFWTISGIVRNIHENCDGK